MKRPLKVLRTTSYLYDGVGRLTHETSGSQTREYTYDRGGNRTSRTINGTTTSQSYNAANQVVGWNYDAAGNLTNDGTGSYTYDALGRMSTAGTTQYRYNGDGTLIQAGQGNTTTSFINDLVAALSQPLQVVRSTRTQLGYTMSFDRAIYGHDRLLSTDQANVQTWYLSDGVGSVQATLDSSGALVTNPDYDAWGNVTSSTTPTPFGFTGEYRDAATGVIASGINTLNANGMCSVIANKNVP